MHRWGNFRTNLEIIKQTISQLEFLNKSNQKSFSHAFNNSLKIDNLYLCFSLSQKWLKSYLTNYRAAEEKNYFTL